MGNPVAFDPLLHHIGVGTTPATLFGFMVNGGGAKQLANPVFSKPSDVGTDDLIGVRALSNWTVDDFSGGEFQPDWVDPAMFAECVGMLPDQLSRRIRTIRPLDLFLGGDTGVPSGLTPVSMEQIGGFLFVIFNTAAPAGKVYRYNPANPSSSPQRETVDTTALPAGKLITAVGWNHSTSRVWIGTNQPRVWSHDYNPGAATGSRLVRYGDYGSPGATKITGIHIFGLMKLLVTENNAAGVSTLDDDSDVWMYVSGNGANAKWSHVGNLPGSFVTSVTYNNAVYILSRNANMKTYLSMTQGSQVFPVVEFPYFFRGQAMIEYAGRLYIGGTGWDLDGNDQHGELFEISGASLRLVRTFGGYANDPTPATEPGQMATTNPGTKPVKRKRVFKMMKTLCVAEGLLWMPDSSYTGLEAYDATTDAFYGGPRFRHGDDPALEFVKAVPFGDSIYLWGSGSTTAKTGLYRTERLADTGEPYYPHFITSDFMPEPARLKAWSRFVCHTRQVTPILYYSVDSGETWTNIGSGSTVVSGGRRVTSYDLAAAGVPPSTAIRFKLNFPMTGAATEPCAYLTAHSCSFLIRGDTKRRWMFTVAAADIVEDRNRDTMYQVPVDVSNALWALKDTAAPIVLRDMDGVSYNVFITDISDQYPAYSGTNERFVNVTFVEV